jgi:hypothetical protein
MPCKLGPTEAGEQEQIDRTSTEMHTCSQKRDDHSALSAVLYFCAAESGAVESLVKAKRRREGTKPCTT